MNHTIDYENLNKLNKPFFEEYKKAFDVVLESGWFILGNQVRLFEEEFANYCNTKHCVGLASGLDGLILALKALDLPAKCEVIVPSNTYIATILAILQCGFKPVLVEPEIHTYNISPDKIQEAITPLTKVIMVVHLYGKSCTMDRILQTATDNRLYVIEDCAQSHGAKFKNTLTGNFGDINAFSFYPTKNLGALGDAGAITTNSDMYAEKIKMLRNYGSKIKYHNEVIGFNSRLDEMQAAFLSIKLRSLDAINSHKRKLADLYFAGLKKDFILPVVHTDYYDVYHIFNIRHEKRDQLKDYLFKNDIKTEIHYPIPPHKQKAMAGILSQSYFPISEEIHATTLSLPISYFHTENEILKVVDIINKF